MCIVNVMVPTNMIFLFCTKYCDSVSRFELLMVIKIEVMDITTWHDSNVVLLQLHILKVQPKTNHSMLVTYVTSTRFEVFMVVKIQINVFLVVMSCSVVVDTNVSKDLLLHGCRKVL
jgi:hypothetical protein